MSSSLAYVTSLVFTRWNLPGRDARCQASQTRTDGHECRPRGIPFVTARGRLRWASETACEWAIERARISGARPSRSTADGHMEMFGSVTDNGIK